MAHNWAAIRLLPRGFAAWPFQVLCSPSFHKARQHSESGSEDHLRAAISVQLCAGGRMAVLPMHGHIAAWGKLTADADGLSHRGRRHDWNRSNHPSSIGGRI